MQFGVLSPNTRLNARIYEMFEHIDPADAPVFARKFRSESDEQRLHTFRELIVGSHLRTYGLNARYERRVRGKTPDWVILDGAAQVGELVDVATLHQRREKRTDMNRTLSTGAVWSGWVSIPPDHIYAKIEQKANSYAALVDELQRPYTIFIFGEFRACVDAGEVEHVLCDLHGGLFAAHPLLAGVAYLTESFGRYRYSYFPNDMATYPSPMLLRLHGDGSVAAA